MIIILVLSLSLGLLAMTMFPSEDIQDVRLIVYATVGVSAILLLLFYQLETVVDESGITLTFGIGLIKKQILLSDIERTEVVKNKFWYGWGIRLTPHGWLWNVAGYDAVEITYKNGNRKFRIGTKDANLLKEEIDKRL